MKSTRPPYSTLILPYPLRLRMFLALLLAAVALAVLLGALWIPFGFQSDTILYKFGLERTCLRTGQVIGMLVGCLMLFQLVLAGRLKILDRIFSINRLFRTHRLNAMAIAALAPLHPLLILWSEGLDILNPDRKNWPQFLGLALFMIVWGIFVSARFRKRIGLPFHLWFPAHQLVTQVAVAALGVHVLYACDSFARGTPRALVLWTLGLYFLTYLGIKLGRALGGRSCRVTNVTPAARDTFHITLQPEDGKPLAHAPGQFLFVRFKSPHLSGETHPFTISSPPAAGTTPFDLTIAACGDWTRRIHLLQPGDRAQVGGPFGCFGASVLEDRRELIMIAGGIGITPMLSILGFLAAGMDKRRITLLWSNRTRGHRVYPEQLSDLTRQLPCLQVRHILTREPHEEAEKGRLDQAKLERLLSDKDRRSTVLLCGPPGMMGATRRALIRIGFPRRAIVMERFEL
jgi:predicted ferric reductase